MSWGFLLYLISFPNNTTYLAILKNIRPNLLHVQVDEPLVIVGPHCVKQWESRWFWKKERIITILLQVHLSTLTNRQTARETHLSVPHRTPATNKHAMNPKMTLPYTSIGSPMVNCDVPNFDPKP